MPVEPPPVAAGDYAEWSRAIAQQIFLQKMSPAEAQQTYRHLEKDRVAGLWAKVEMPDSVFNVCADLARRHGPRLGARTLDSLHVAAALQLKAEWLWTFDERQAKLAKAEGLVIPTRMAGHQMTLASP